MKKNILLMLTVLAFTPHAFADWVLQSEESALKFISVKNNAIAEVSEFKQLQGTVDKQGKVDIAIDLASVDTSIAVRDERMIKALFEVPTFSQAKLMGKVDVAKLTSLKAGERYIENVSLLLSLHGVEKTVKAQVLVIKLADEKWLVSSAKPVILNARDYQLTGGIDKLTALAGLAAINAAIPITFNFVFK